MYDMLSKMNATLQLELPPPLGSFPNPAPIAALPFSGTIGVRGMQFDGLQPGPLVG